MRKGFGKLGFVCLALIVVLGGTGVGYGYWSDALTISGQVETGQLNWQLMDYDCYCLSIPRDSTGELEQPVAHIGDCAWMSDSEQAQPAFGYFTCMSDVEDGLCNLCDCDSVEDLDCCHLSNLMRHQLAMMHSDCYDCCDWCDCCAVEGIDTDGDGDIDRLDVTVTDAEECSPGAVWFIIGNKGTIPAKITNVEITPDDFATGEEVEVWKIVDPSRRQRQIDPWDDPDTWWRDETQAFCLIGILVKEPGTYHFEVSVDADYWHLA